MQKSPFKIHYLKFSTSKMFFLIFFLNKNQEYFGLFEKFCALICTDGSKLRVIESLWD
jgi:hypothetical protein